MCVCAHVSSMCVCERDSLCVCVREIVSTCEYVCVKHMDNSKDNERKVIRGKRSFEQQAFFWTGSFNFFRRKNKFFLKTSCVFESQGGGVMSTTRMHLRLKKHCLNYKFLFQHFLTFLFCFFCLRKNNKGGKKS